AHRSKNRDGWGNHAMEESRRGPASRGRIIEEVLSTPTVGVPSAVQAEWSTRLIVCFLASLLGPSLAVKSWLPLHLLGRKAARKFEAAASLLCWKLGLRRYSTHSRTRTCSHQWGRYSSRCSRPSGNW